MLRSGLLRCSLIIALCTIGIRANEDVVEGGEGLPSHRAAQRPRDGEPLLWNKIERVAAKEDDTIDRLIIQRLPDSTETSAKEQACPVLTTPRPTAPPRKRQDDGQVQDLSSRIESLSQSATKALSSVSSSASSAISLVSQSAQSVRQSADQAVQSANQNADNANRQLSQTKSSASSALSAASARASDDMERSLSSMSSRISSNMASARSSASSAISSAQAKASSSAADAVNIAASQIQEARADASGVRGDANSVVSQVQSNAFSGTNVAIIVTVSVVGAAILTAIAAFFIVRYRLKKRRDREASVAAPVKSGNESPYEKPIAVRGSPASPRFTPFGGGTGYPMDKDKFKLRDLTLSPFLKKKTNEDGPSSVGFARSDYTGDDSDVYGVSPSSFRLQKDNNIKNATSVRLIRVGSNAKSKAKPVEEDKKALLSPIASPQPPSPVQTAAPRTQPTPVAVSSFPPPPRSPSPPPQPRQPVEPPLAAPPPAASTKSRLRFRDSSEVESAEPSPATPRPALRRTTTTSMRNTNTASLRASNATAASGRPKNAGPASFATFPRVRDGPPRGSAAEAILNRNRGLGGVAQRLREEEDRIRNEMAAGKDNESQTDGAASTASRALNWPFGNS
ncbi:hypothetical protein GGR52DRAFT_40049 [Hypoxylon sp. FL1284]|nr:hypothetical protein GGR52DRAFT_40049 [Hypoxylon sp. FL1284]